MLSSPLRQFSQRKGKVNNTVNAFIITDNINNSIEYFPAPTMYI
jgi:hypothetical protein